MNRLFLLLILVFSILEINAECRIDTTYSYKVNGAKRIPLSRVINTYNNLNQLSRVLSQNWDSTQKSWMNINVKSLTYNNKELLTLSRDSSWDKAKSSWKPSIQNTQMYDSLGKFTEKVGQYWFDATSQWVYTSRSLLTYDSICQNYDWITQQWNSTLNEWNNFFRNDYTCKSLVTSTPNCSFTVTNQGQNKVCLQVTNLADCISQTCKNTTLGMNSIVKQSGFVIYPNPNSGQFNIEIKNPQNAINIEFYDLLGHLIHQIKPSEVQTSYSVNLNASNGIYIVRINNGQQNYFSKVTINR